MFTMHIPKCLWEEVVLTTSYLIKRMPSRILNYQTLISTLIKSYHHFKFVNSLHLWIFSCPKFVQNHSANQSKLEPRATKCVFLGYSPNQKGYRCYCTITKKKILNVQRCYLLWVSTQFPSHFTSRGDITKWRLFLGIIIARSCFNPSYFFSLYQVKIVFGNYHCSILLQSLLFLLLMSWSNLLCNHQIKKT